MADPGTTVKTVLSDTQQTQLMDLLVEQMAYYSARGSSQYVTQTLMSKHDRFGTSPVQINAENVGLTFITRPRLNLSTNSLRQDRVLAMMDTLDPSALMFAVRCNLDTVFGRSKVAAPLAERSPWLNTESPFNIPLSNMLVGITGFPDFSVEVETTEAGYYSEDMTMARGSDMGRRTYPLSLTFRDMQGGYVTACIYYWLRAMALQMEGVTVAYPDDRAANRLNYTVSIYRFIMDPSMRTITKWAKATGCFPVSLPLGDMFNFSPGDSFVHHSQQFSVQFLANNITYMDPIHLQAFNKLVDRYASKATIGGLKNAPVTAEANFAGLPYVDLTSGTNELFWKATTEELTDPSAAAIASLTASLSSATDSALIAKLTTSSTDYKEPSTTTAT